MSLSLTASNAQIKNAKTTSVKIYGNCSMCESRIEKAGNVKKIAKVDWNEDTNMATITYNSKETNQDEILKRIALAGYDSDQFLAPDDVYSSLPQCCQYKRVNKTMASIEAPEVEMNVHENHNQGKSQQQEAAQLKIVFDKYFAIKDALIQSDGKTASAKAKELINVIASVNMGKLTNEEHMIFMKVMKDLSYDAAHISETQEVSHQRGHFSSLSDNVYKLLKVSTYETPIYYQHCPMYNEGKGGNWLSKESAIKNPYYGSQMLTCGKTTETIK